jgi:pimeloyl-ACP methyl ester carboxylesterase
MAPVPATGDVHGWGSSPEAFGGLIKPLCQQRRVLAPALPGFAGSPEPEERWGTAEYSELLLKWLDYKGLEKIDLTGHSFGGRIAIAFCAKHPERVPG